MTFGNTKEVLAYKSVLHDGDVEISERAFNLIIGGMLLWGLMLNVLTVKLFSTAVLDFACSGNGGSIIYIGYIISALIGTFLVARPNAVASFIGYNLIAVPIGIVLCVVLSEYDPKLISNAVTCTGIITLVFIVAGSINPGFFLSVGRTLITSIILLILGELVLALFGWHSMMLCWLGAGIFGMFIAYDWARCNVCACTVDNAIDAAANLYLDIINLFLHVLQLLGKGKKND